jgi:hypothetical protein
MADLSLTPVATQIKPVQGMGLADMMNIARGAQQYQQAAQANPLELQRLQAEANVATGTEQPRIRGAEATAQTAETGAESSKFDFANKQTVAVANRLTPLINNPLIISAEQNPNAVNKEQLHSVLRGYAEEQANALGIPKDKAAQLIQPYLDQAEKNPGNMRQFLKEKLLTTLDQGPRTTAMGGVGVSTAPTAPQAPQQVGAGAEVAPTMRMPYPVRSASQPYIQEPTEAKDQASGQAYRDNLVNAQTGLAQNRRNAEEVISAANNLANDLTWVEKGGGFASQVGQKIRMFINSAEYETLAKDLANMHISNAKAMGGVGNTVAGLDMAQVAGGTIKVPPEVLIKIARRVQADQTNLDMQANGAQQFSQRFGDNNMKAYQQAWNANARDTKIFEAMNILENETNPDKLKTEFEKLFPSAEKRKTILKQYKNLKSLAATGVVVNKLED